MFIQFHRLKSYTNAVLPNRGQDGLSKRLRVGDAVRQRISSQCMKAALRDGNLPLFVTGPDGEVIDDTMRDLAASLGIGMAHRSRYVFPGVVYPALVDAFGDEDLAATYTAAFSEIFGAEDGGKKDKKPTDAKPYDKGFVDQPLVLGEVEAQAIIQAIRTFKDNGVAPEKMRELFEKRGAARKVGETVEQAVANVGALKAHCGIDGALFGRMITGSVVGRVDSCMLVSHALTVHPLVSVGDYFSVKDTLKRELEFADDNGASHTNSVELTSGLFYEHWVFDVRQAVKNFAGLDASQIARIAGWLVRAVYALEPAAKRGSTAPFGNVPFYMIELGRRSPRTLMDAFEKALPHADSEAAVAALLAYREASNRKAGKTTALTLDSEDVAALADEKDIPLVEALSKLVETQVASAVEALLPQKQKEAA